jgi:PAS domain-containing protein
MNVINDYRIVVKIWSCFGMIFKSDSFKLIRKQMKLTTEEVALKAGIHRVTISNWERCKKVPSEKNIRLLAFVLEVPVSIISDLEDDHPISEGDLSEMAESWQAFSGIQQQNITDRFENSIKQLQKQHKEFINASVVMNSLLSAMHTIFYVKDTNLNYITVNDSFLNNVGLNAGFSATGKDDSGFFPTREAKDNSDEDVSVLRTGKEIKREGYIPGSRKKKWGIIRKIPIFDVNKKIAGVIATFVDITERKKSESIRQILEQSINSTNDMFWIGKYVDERYNEFSYLFLNDGTEKVFKIKKDEFNDQKWSDCLHPDCKYLLKLGLNDVKEYPLEIEYKIIWPNGEIRKVHEKIFEKENYYFGTVRDITEYEEIQKVKDLVLEAMDKVLNYYVWIIEFDNGEKRFVYSGPEKKAIEVYGYSVSEFIKSETDFWKKIVLPEDLPSLMNTFVEDSFPKTIKYRIKDENGKIRWIQDHLMKYQYGEKVFYLGLSKTITGENK